MAKKVTASCKIYNRQFLGTIEAKMDGKPDCMKEAGAPYIRCGTNSMNKCNVHVYLI